MEKMNLGAYANQIGVTRQAVLYRIGNKLPLPGVIKREFIAGRWIVNVNSDFATKKEAEKYFKKRS